MAGINLNTDLLKRLGGRLTYLGSRHDVMVQNIANMETPGYSSKDVEFKGFLEGAAAEMQNEAKGVKNPIFMAPDVENTTSTRDPKPNGNNVNMEMQMAELADNNVEFMIATEVIKKNLSMMKFSTQ